MSHKIEPSTDMIKIGTQMLTDGLPLPTDVFIKMPSGSFLLIAKKGDKGKLAELHLIKDKNAEIYIPKANYSMVVLFNMHLVDKTISLPSVSPQFKLTSLLGLTQAAFNDLSDKGALSLSVEKCKQITVFIQKLSSQIHDFNQLTQILTALPHSIMTHSLACAMVSLSIAEEMDITLSRALENIVLGSLLHDVGLYAETKTFLLKPRTSWTPEERKEYENHPTKAAQILRDIKDIPTDVLSIVQEHHEWSNGTGFPKRLRDLKINPMAKIVALSDHFVDLIYDQSNTGKKLTAAEALSVIEFDLSQPFNKKAFEALKSLIHANQKSKTG